MLSLKEGDFVETLEGIISSVKGIIHPSTHIVAFPKYVPNPKGDRVREGKAYVKISSLSEEYRFLRENHSEYLRFDPVFGCQMAEIPAGRIAKTYCSKDIFQSLKRRSKLDKVESDVVEFATMLIDKSGISSFNMGVSGSVIFGFHRETSDVDLVVHSKADGLKAYRALEELVDQQLPVKRYGVEDLKSLYKFRVQDTRVNFRQFLSTERRKTLQGKFRERDYFIRLIEEPSEIGETYGEKRFSPMGNVELESVVSDAVESMFTPCRYGLRDVTVLNRKVEFAVKEIVSFRGRFCEQADVGERVFVRGKLEKVSFKEDEYCVVVIGGGKDDVMIPFT